MTKVKDDNFYVIYGWMVKQLNLKGVALQIFAIIYGFDRDGEGSFTGSLKYLMDFTKTSKNTILKSLRELMEKDYIKKTENIVNSVRFCTYKINTPLVQKMSRDGSEIAPGGGAVMKPGDSAVSEHNNEDVYNKWLIDKEKVQNVIDTYHKICISFPKIVSITNNRKKEILSILKIHSLQDVEKMFINAENSSFLKGSDGWKASLDWMMKEENFAKVLEGNYADRAKREVSGWTEPTLGAAEIEAIRRVLKEDVPTENCDHE